LFFFGIGSFRHEVETEKRTFDLFAVARAKPAACQRLARAGHPEGVEAAGMNESDAARHDGKK
jgi:hypothetical protein